METDFENTSHPTYQLLGHIMLLMTMELALLEPHGLHCYSQPEYD